MDSGNLIAFLKKFSFGRLIGCGIVLRIAVALVDGVFGLEINEIENFNIYLFVVALSYTVFWMFNKSYSDEEYEDWVPLFVTDKLALSIAKFIASSTFKSFVRAYTKEPTKASPAPVVSMAWTFGALNFIISSSSTYKTPCSPHVISRLHGIVFENYNIFSSVIFNPLIIWNSFSFGISQSIFLRKVLSKIFPGAGLKTVVILFCFA